MEGERIMEVNEEESLQKKLNFGQRFLGIFFSPGETFHCISKKPDWFLPLLVIIIFTLGLTFVWMAKVDFSEMLRESLAASGKLESFSEAQLEQMEKVQKIAVPAGALFGSILGVPITYLLISLVFFAGVKVAGARKVSFRDVFSVYCYSSLVYVINYVLVIVVILGRSSVTSAPDAVFQASLAFFLPLEKAQTAPYQLAASADLFSVWALVLLVLGLRAMTGFSMKRSGVAAVSVWILLVFLRVAGVVIVRRISII